MLISGDEIIYNLKKLNIKITGALHVGAHDCEELPFYKNMGLQETDVIWIEAMKHKVEENIKNNFKNIYHGVIADVDDKDILFNVANNGQSSSILEFKTHSKEHPEVHFIKKEKYKTITLDSFFKRNNINPNKFNFWNLDIQGAELFALKGASEIIQHADAIYLEVNEKELYEDCPRIYEIDLFLQIHHFKRIRTEMTVHGWGDALYIHNKYLK